MTAPTHVRAVGGPSDAVQGLRRRGRALYATGAASLAGAGVALVAATDTSLVVLLIFAVLPDVAILGGLRRGLAPGQLHPRAVPLYNALHRLAMPAAIAAVGVFAGPRWFTAAAGWAFHICFDHAVGLGLRTPDGFVRNQEPTR
jgi:Domain of unknown function (DUF4260)